MTLATRPPNQPPTPPPPSGPKPPAPPPPAADNIFALAESLGFPTPARRDPDQAPAVGADVIATTGGPATFALPQPLMGFALRPPMPGNPPPQPSPLPMPPPPPPLA